MNKIAEDPRIDPRLKALFSELVIDGGGDVVSREAMSEQANREEALAAREAMKALFDACDSEEIAPAAGLTLKDYEFVSDPDVNVGKIQFIRPNSAGPLPCVYYIHGGGMQVASCFYGIYRAWGRLIAGHGVADGLGHA